MLHHRWNNVSFFTIGQLGAGFWRSSSEACHDEVLPSRFPSVFDLTEMIRQHEGKTLEFKRDLSSPDKVMRTLVAFANGAGGRWLIGVEDRSRKFVGVPELGWIVPVGSTAKDPRKGYHLTAES
ncbi:MAG TPA: ATP-binding protein [Candidatus Paceibacterota bacterium]|nr:ATP-binding protein [Candidatus Paceibacterota bacterium]